MFILLVKNLMFMAFGKNNRNFHEKSKIVTAGLNSETLKHLIKEKIKDLNIICNLIIVVK
jgi:hypothetical protein